MLKPTVHCLFGQPAGPYFDTRFAVLRKPLGLPLGSERLADDSDAYHAWVELEENVVSVGRAHIIEAKSDGSGSDHAGPNASLIPAFGPLKDGSAIRPAFQIRQMGTLPIHQRKGFAALTLDALEQALIQHEGAKSGFLQARVHAIPFYQSQGWNLIDEAYEIAGIGPHRSMTKSFND